MTKSGNVLSHFSCLILTISRVYTLLHVSPNKTACARQHDQRLSNAVLYSPLRQEDQYTLHVTVPVSLTASSLPPSHDNAILTLAFVDEGGLALKSRRNRSFCECLNPPRIQIHHMHHHVAKNNTPQLLVGRNASPNIILPPITWYAQYNLPACIRECCCRDFPDDIGDGPDVAGE